MVLVMVGVVPLLVDLDLYMDVDLDLLALHTAM